MKLNDFDYLLQLPGEDQERRWLQERLETLSVREGTVLAAATLKAPPEDMAQAITCLQSLDEFEVRVDSGSLRRWAWTTCSMKPRCRGMPCHSLI